MIARNIARRRYHPCFESLERKQLLSADLSTYGAAVIVQATAPASSQAPHVHIITCGTGKSIRIVTS